LRQHSINVYLQWIETRKQFKMEHVQTTGSQRNINVAKKQQILRSRNVEILPT